MSSSSVDLSIIIPYFNRADTIGSTLDSIAQAKRDWRTQVILIDDGSSNPAATELPMLLRSQLDLIIRQSNQGLLFARLAGLREALGEFVLFLDSDDLVGPDKFDAQLGAMRDQNSDVSYSDSAQIDLSRPSLQRSLEAHNRAEVTADSTDFFIRIQPPPHSPIFRRSTLISALDSPRIPVSPDYNAVAEVWFYLNASFLPWRVCKVEGFHTWVGKHSGPRITGHWERMGVAATLLTTRFFEACGQTIETAQARDIMARCVFHAWRALPYDFAPKFQRHLLALWQKAPHPAASVQGGRGFLFLAKLLGPVAAGRILRRLRGHPYASCRTLNDQELAQILSQIPPES